MRKSKYSEEQMIGILREAGGETPVKAVLRLLSIYHRTIRHAKPAYLEHFSKLRRYPANPKTLGEHLRKKRIDMQLSMQKLAEKLGDGITDTAIEKWEKDQNYPTRTYRVRLIEFLGFDPESNK